MLKMFAAAALLLALVEASLLVGGGASDRPAPARRLAKKPKEPDALYPELYDGKFPQNRMESLGTPEFEAVNMMERESQLDQLQALVAQFKRAMVDTQESMKTKMEELETFMKE